jgi:hypothetical protein
MGIGCKWRRVSVAGIFHLREPCKSRLDCTFTTSHQSGSIQTNWAEDIAGLRFQTERDVAVLIGRRRTTQGRPVASEEFLGGCKYIWIFVASLTCPRLLRQATGTCFLTKLSMVESMLTVCCSLGQIRPTRFLGYKFTQGKLTRDRRWLMERHGPAERVCRIWESTLQAHEDILLLI